MREQLLPKLLERTQPNADRMVSGSADDHDVFPALLWTLLKSDDAFREKMEALQQTQTAQLEAVTQLVEDARKSISDQATSSKTELVAICNELNQSVARLAELQKVEREAIQTYLRQASEYLTKATQSQLTSFQSSQKYILWASTAACVTAAAHLLIDVAFRML